MKRTYKIITTAFFLIINLNIQAQELELFSDFNFGVPISSSLKDFHKGLADQIPFSNLETTDNFSYNYGFTIGLRFKKKASFFISNKVSGAKSSVADYSGNIELTNELKGFTFGLEYLLPIKEYTNSNLNLGLRAMVTRSNLFLISNSRILNQIQKDNLDFRSIDYGLAAGLNYEYSLKFITIRAYLNLDVYLGGKIKLKEDNPDGLYLTGSNNEKVTTGWSGFTSGIGFVIPLVK